MFASTQPRIPPIALALAAVALGCAPATGGPAAIETTSGPRTSTQQVATAGTVGLLARVGDAGDEESVELVATVTDPDGHVSSHSMGRRVGHVDPGEARHGDHEPIVIEREGGTVVVWVVMGDDGYVELRERRYGADVADHVVLERVALDEFEPVEEDAPAVQDETAAPSDE